MNKMLVLTQGSIGGEFIALSRLTNGWAKQSKGEVDLLAFTDHHSGNSIVRRGEYVAFNRILLINHSKLNGPFSLIRNLISDYKTCSKALKSLNLSEYCATISSDYIMSLALAHTRLRVGTPRIFAFHGLRSIPIKQFRDINYRQLIIKLGELMAWVISTHVVVPSLQAKNYIEARIKFLPIRKKIMILPNLVSESLLKQRNAQLLDKFQIRYELQDKLVLAYIGRIIPRKGIERLVAIYVQIKLTYPDAVLVFAYPSIGLDSKLLDWLTAKASDPNIILLPDLNESEIALLYRSASVLLLLSELEFAPLVLIEAIAAGCICIATDCGNSKEVLRTINSRLIVSTDQEIIRTISWIQTTDAAEKQALKRRMASIAASHKAVDIINKFQSIFSQ
jgi:glycosyltransferase involved in cell wall biosynthesis